MRATIAAGFPTRAMSDHDQRSAQRAASGPAPLDVAAYAVHARIGSELAYETARHCLLDALSGGFEALACPDCMRLIGPIVPGATMLGGARVPGTSYELDPVQAAFNIGAMIGWRERSDGRPADGCGHPSDSVGGLLAVADWHSRRQVAVGEAPLTVRDLLAGMIKAYEIEGVTTCGGGVDAPALAHLPGVRVATAAVAAAMLGGTPAQVVEAVASARSDGAAPGTGRRTPGAGSRPGWAAGDATARGVRHALMALAGELGRTVAPAAPDCENALVRTPRIDTLRTRVPVDFGADGQGCHAEGASLRLQKFAASVAAHFGARQAGAIAALVADPGRLEALSVPEFVAALVRN